MTSRQLAEKIYAFMSNNPNGLGSWDINPFTGEIHREVKLLSAEPHGTLSLDWLPEVPFLEAWLNQTMRKFVISADGVRMHTESQNNFALGYKNIRIKLRQLALRDVLYIYEVD